MRVTYIPALSGGVLFFAPLLMILFRRRYPRWWFDWNLESDLGPVLPSIQARTLLVHRRDAALLDPESVQAAAKLIRTPDAPGFPESTTCRTSVTPTR